MQQGAKPDQAAKKAARAVRLNEEHIAEAGLAAAPHQHVAHHINGGRVPPAVRLLDKAEVLEITRVSFPTIWKWMRAGTFPRARIVGGKSMWLSSEIDAWLAALEVRPLKGDVA
jgi:predicted DNA-binding transcriptional regulator AlpA